MSTRHMIKMRRPPRRIEDDGDGGCLLAERGEDRGPFFGGHTDT
jgi:hypothetical protein